MSKTPLFILALFNFITLISCRSDKSKTELWQTTQVCNKKLFVETYIIFGGGAGGGDRVSEYLTDSLNFRIYIGTYVQTYKHYWYNCIGDSIQINEMDEANGNKIISTKTYLITHLQHDKKFE